MSNISDTKQEQLEVLSLICSENNVPIDTVLRLLAAEKVKKLLRRRALIQDVIDKEIENLPNNED